MGYLKKIDRKYKWIPTLVMIAVGVNWNEESFMDLFDLPKCDRMYVKSDLDYNTLGPYLVEAGLFESRGEARRNNWDRPLTEITDVWFKGRSTRIVLWRPR